jgi:peptidoglycan/LPS O-acetylase OafA/YrhL
MARRLPALRMLGLMTYPLYLLHIVVGAALLGRLAARGVPQDLALVLVLLAALAASYVIAAHLEPPLQRWTRELLCRLRPAPAS